VSGEVVKFPIGRVVRLNRLRYPLDYNPTMKELDRAVWSIDQAIASLKRQRASVFAQWRHAFAKITREEHAAGAARARVTDAGYWPVDGVWP